MGRLCLSLCPVFFISKIIHHILVNVIGKGQEEYINSVLIHFCLYSEVRGYMSL
jgi:hypothetical protein